jgi:hypothetical protein
MRRNGEEEGPLECPRCRAEAEWRFLDETKEMIEILCSDCGRFEMSRTEFEQAESDVVEAPERRD